MFPLLGNTLCTDLIVAVQFYNKIKSHGINNEAKG